MADSRKTKVSELDSSMEITDEDDDHSEVTVPSGRTTEPEEAEPAHYPHLKLPKNREKKPK